MCVPDNSSDPKCNTSPSPPPPTPKPDTVKLDTVKLDAGTPNGDSKNPTVAAKS